MYSFGRTSFFFRLYSVTYPNIDRSGGSQLDMYSLLPRVLPNHAFSVLNFVECARFFFCLNWTHEKIKVEPKIVRSGRRNTIKLGHKQMFKRNCLRFETWSQKRCVLWSAKCIKTEKPVSCCFIDNIIQRELDVDLGIIWFLVRLLHCQDLQWFCTELVLWKGIC